MKTLYESILSTTKSGKDAYYIQAINKMFESGIANQKLIDDLEKQVAVYKANNKNIKAVIQAYIELAGNTCSLNWIDTSGITNMSGVFDYSEFNGDISKWDVSKVVVMNSMFAYSNFNGDISKWNVSNVEDMSYMFFSSKFNGDISNWDISNVKDVHGMFKGSIFNQDISKWNVKNSVFRNKMFDNCPIKEEYKPKFKH